MQILSNGELAHSLLDPIKDRLSHYEDILSVVAGPYQVNDSEDFDKLATLVSNLQENHKNVVTLMNPFTEKAYTFIVERENDTVEFFQTLADTTAETYSPIVSTSIGKIAKIADEIKVEGDWILQSADGLSRMAISQAAETSADMLTVYSMMESTITTLLSDGKVDASHIISILKSKVSGVRGVAKTFYTDLTDQLSTNNISGVISCIKQYLTSANQSISFDGSYSFTETNVTKDWLSGVVLSNIGNIVSTVGQVVSALFLPVGLALQGIGALVTGVTNFLSGEVNGATVAKTQQSEGWQLGTHVAKHSFSQNQVTYNYFMELINGKGPQHLEFCGLDGYVWCSNPNHPTPGLTHDDILFELFPSCKGYVDTPAMYAFVQAHFSCSVKSNSTGGPILNWNTHPEITVPYSYKDVLELYVDNLIPVTPEELDYYSDVNYEGPAALMHRTALWFMFLLTWAGHEAGEMYDTDPTFQKQTPDLTDNYFDTGSEVALTRMILCPWSLPDTGGSWDDVNPNPNMGVEIIVGHGAQWNWTLMTSYSEEYAASISGKTLRSIVSHIEQVVKSDVHNEQEMEEFFVAPFQYPVVVRYPFRLLPPSYDRASLIGGIIFLAAVAVVSIAVVAITAVKVRNWRQRQQAKTQAQTENAWANMCQNPTPENIQAYRSACFKQNTIGKIFGCSSVSNTNYWGGSDADTSNPDLSSIVTLIAGNH